MPEPGSAFTARIAAVGDRSAHVRAHARVPKLLDALRLRDRLDLDLYWIPTPEAEDGDVLVGFDGIWLTPGSPYRSEAGALTAVRTAREQGIPFLGTCGGFQHALLEYARNVCGLSRAAHSENSPEATGELLIEPLACSLAGREGAVRIVSGSLAERVLGSGRTVERYQCSYGVNPSYLEVLRQHGMQLTGLDDAGDVRIAELPGHPFFLCTLFQPELAGDGTVAHPVIRAFGTAAARHAGQPDPVPAP